MTNRPGASFAAKRRCIRLEALRWQATAWISKPGRLPVEVEPLEGKALKRRTYHEDRHHTKRRKPNTHGNMFKREEQAYSEAFGKLYTLYTALNQIWSEKESWRNTGRESHRVVADTEPCLALKTERISRVGTATFVGPNFRLKKRKTSWPPKMQIANV